MGNHVGDWTDVVDLDYTCKELWDYQIESLKMWAGIVDGFRCDMACEVPLEFWQETIAGLRADYPGMFMLAEGEEPQLHSLFHLDFYIQGHEIKLSNYHTQKQFVLIENE